MGGKNRVQVRADMRLDLKDSGALWSNPELNRCLEQAISDLSRMLPLEKVYEERLGFTVTDEAFTTPIDIDEDRVVDNESLASVSAGSLATIDGQPDVPRPLTATLTDADDSITGMTLIIKGMDENEKGITETLHYSTGDSKTLTGKKYFKYVREVEIAQINSNAAGDVLDVGVGDFEDVWIFLANKPIKYGTGTGVSTFTRGTDYEMDYRGGRIKAVSGGSMAANTAYTIDYTKFQLGIDLVSLPDLIRVERVEYPVGEIPQTFITWDMWGTVLYITGGAEQEEQGSMREDSHIAVYFAAEHRSPTEYSPGTYPEFLENTVIVAAAAYALFIYALKHDHQAATDEDSSRTALTSANSGHTALSTALANVKKYLDNNSEADAVGILKDITDDVAELRTKIIVALDAVATYLDAVAGDLSSADSARANYMGGTANYVDGGTAPDVKKYLDDGDAFLNTVALGGEGVTVPDAYARYARSVKDALVAAHEQDRSFYIDDARARTNAALGYVQEAAQRLASLRTYIEQSQGYVSIANMFVRKAEGHLATIGQYLQQAAGYAASAVAEMSLADRFRTEALTRRDEAWNIWRDRRQYIGDFAQSSMKQMPSYDSRNSGR